MLLLLRVQAAVYGFITALVVIHIHLGRVVNWKEKILVAYITFVEGKKVLCHSSQVMECYMVLFS